MAKDVVTFLSWAAEPEHDERKKLGIKAVIIFSTLFVISVYVKRFKWGPIKNRKICMCRDVFKESPAEDCFQSINLPLTLTRIPLFHSLVDVQGVWVNLLIENLDHTFKKQMDVTWAYVTKHSLTLDLWLALENNLNSPGNVQILYNPISGFPHLYL